MLVAGAHLLCQHNFILTTSILKTPLNGKSKGNGKFFALAAFGRLLTSMICKSLWHIALSLAVSLFVTLE